MRNREHRNHTKSIGMNGKEAASRVRPCRQILSLGRYVGGDDRRNGEEDRDGVNGDKGKWCVKKDARRGCGERSGRWSGHARLVFDGREGDVTRARGR